MVNKKNMSINAAKTTKSLNEQSFNSRLQECPIAIIGMASIFANAQNIEQYWDNIFESVDAIMDVPASRWAIDDYYSDDIKAADKTYCKRGGFLPEIDFDPMEFGLPPNILELTDIAQLLSLVVAREVLNDAGIGDGSGYDRDKVGITLGVGGGQKQISPLTSRLQGPVLDKVLKASGIDANDRSIIIDKFKKAYIGWEENSFPGMLGNVIAGRIANRFDFGGTNCVVDAACAGSLAAIKLAVSDLLEYRSEVMISGGVCCDNSPFMYMSFSKTPAFTTNDDIRPFDDNSKGMMIGEGIGMMAFKRLEDAERDGDRIYAVLKGIGTSSDGRFKSIYAPRSDGQAKALRRAYNDAGFDPKTCGLIEAHGTGTKAGDAAEFGGLKKLFADNNNQKQHIALGSVKSQIGHTKSAAGSAGMIKAVLALHHKVLPPTIHIDQPNTSLDIENSPLYLNSETRPWMPREDGAPRRAGVSSFGFGGTNYHMVLEEYQAVQQGQYRLTNVPQTILFSAKDEQALVIELKRWRSDLSIHEDDQKYSFNALVTNHTLKTPSISLARCGFIAKNASEAISMIDKALKQFSEQSGVESWSVPTGIYYRQSGIKSKGQVVALFSGQGSQYVNMGSDLVCNFPSVMHSIAEMDNEFKHAGLSHLSNVTYPIPVYTKQAQQQQQDQLRLTQHAQPAIGSFSVSLFKLFKQAGFKADFTAGHSFGELTALWAAEVLDESDYMMLAQRRGQAMKASDDPSIDAGSMIAVVGEPEKIAVHIKPFKEITIANFNSNNQVVVAGVTSQILLAVEELKKQGYRVVLLPVSAAFHTPLVAHAQKPFAEAIDNAKFNQPKIPVFSNTSGKVHSDKPSDIKKSLKNHILESVHFNKEIENIYAEGGRIFIEFGPKNVLTKLVENILKDKSDVTAIAVNANAKKSADLQVRQAALQMCVLGITLENIDVHSAIKRPLEKIKMSPLAMKLSAASFVSDKTKKQFEDTLNDGWVVKQAKAVPITTSPPQVTEKVIEKVVEKIVYVSDQSLSSVSDSTPTKNTTSADLVSSIEASVGQFVEHQQQLLQVHEQYMQGPQDYAKTFQSVLNSHAETKELPESVDRTLKMYHDFQTETLRVHEKYLNNQTDNMSLILSAETLSPAASDIESNQEGSTQDNIDHSTTKTPTNTPITVVRSTINTSVVAQQPVPTSIQSTASVVAMASAMPTPTIEPTPMVDLNVEIIQEVMLKVVADKTGYPTEMLELEMDMEADLGIDSIKRVEILGNVQELIPDLPDLNPEDLAELRTLDEIINYMKSKVQDSSKSVNPELHVVQNKVSVVNSEPTINLEKIQLVMMEVVAEKTGYPTDMLELDMDMEADLGIDSIKRVEILGAVQETIPDLPELNPEDLAELRTLGEIVEYMQSKVTTTSALLVVSSERNIESAPSTPAPQIDLNKIESVMMNVVAEKTGYPTDMLELDMDMEADLGIDSIKRVEILGAVQETIPDLPELNPEDLAELRTLGEIVEYMQSKVTTTAALLEQHSSSAILTLVAAPETKVVSSHKIVPIDLDKIESVMIAVVAEKTGYPIEMLELDMDMEADLGIDSIKRVEILGAVQETIADLPELNPEDLAELRTLGEIVEYMQLKAGNSNTPVSDIVAIQSDHSLSALNNKPLAFVPAPSSVIAIKRLSSINKIELDVKNANALIVDDGTGSSILLADKLIKIGWSVTVIKTSWVKVNSKKSYSKSVKTIEVDRLEEDEIKNIISSIEPLDTVIYMQPKSSIKTIEYPEASKQSLMLAFLLAKLSHVKEAKTARPSFIIVTRQNGLGIDKNETKTDLIQGGLNGLLKTISHEWPNVFCRTVDMSSKFSADKVAAIVVDELFDVDSSLKEVAYDIEGRFTLIEEVTDSYNLIDGNNIDANSLFLVSGGAKGVTAHCVIRLAEKYQSKFILLGRSKFENNEPDWAKGITEEVDLKKAAMQALIATGSKPTPVKVMSIVKPILANREIAYTLSAIKKVGGQVEYISVDITNRKNVTDAVQHLNNKFGQITGIIHGAGVLADKLIEQKTLADFNAVYSTKIDGLMSMLACVDPSKLKHLALFSSAAGFYGNSGQADYSIANEILNKTAFRFKLLHPETQVLSFNWGPWDGGMVTPELKRMFNERGVYIIPLDAGAELFTNELAANDNRCPQILVGNDLSRDQVDNSVQVNTMEGSPGKK